MVSFLDDANFPDLGFASTNLGKLSANDCLGLGAPHQLIFESLEFLTNDRVDSSFGQQKIEPINEEKAALKSKIERTTIDDVIQIGTSRVKLGKEFDGLVVIDDQVDTVMEDVVPDYGEEKTDKVVDSKYLQPRWCPSGLTRTQKCTLQLLWLVDVRGKEQEKRRDELFNKIKPMTPPKQEWKRKVAPRSSMAEPAGGGQTVVPGNSTAAYSVPGTPTTPPGVQTARV
jgi:hypothetical protein